MVLSEYTENVIRINKDQIVRALVLI